MELHEKLQELRKKLRFDAGTIGAAHLCFTHSDAVFWSAHGWSCAGGFSADIDRHGVLYKDFISYHCVCAVQYEA